MLFYLKGHGQDFGQNVGLFFSFDYLQCFKNQFLVVKCNLDASRWLLSKIQGTQFFVM